MVHYAQPSRSLRVLGVLSRVLRSCAVAALCVWAVGPAPVAAQEAAGEVVATGKKIRVEFAMYVGMDEVLSRDANQPLVMEVGKTKTVPGLEKNLMGLKAGDSKRFSVPPEDGFGFVNPEAFVTLKTADVPEEQRRVGAVLEVRDHEGRQIPAPIVDMTESGIVVDLNHPLAGKHLTFEVTVLSIE